MESEILNDVRTYLGDEADDNDNPVLLIIINRAIRRVCNKRYPWGCSDEEKTAVVKKYREVIFDAAIWYWSKQGAEGQSSHSENGISRGYESEEFLYVDVVPMVKIL